MGRRGSFKKYRWIDKTGNSSKKVHMHDSWGDFWNSSLEILERIPVEGAWTRKGKHRGRGKHGGKKRTEEESRTLGES